MREEKEEGSVVDDEKVSPQPDKEVNILQGRREID
jgi:hypothetical protein